MFRWLLPPSFAKFKRRAGLIQVRRRINNAVGGVLGRRYASARGLRS